MISQIEELFALIRKGEGRTLDFKYTVNDPQKIAKALVAFANGVGGTLLVGVKDNGKIAGTKPDEDFYMIERAVDKYIKPALAFETANWLVDDKSVLEVFVPRASNGPILALDDDGRWKAYLRVDDDNVLVDWVWLKVEQQKKNKKAAFTELTEAEKILLDHLKKHGEITQKEFKKIAGISWRKAGYLLVNLICLGVIVQRLEPGRSFFVAKELNER